MLWFVLRLKTQGRESRSIRLTLSKTRSPQPRNRLRKRNLSRPKKPRRRRNERESFKQSCGERSEDRHHRRRSRFASGPRRRRSDAVSSSLWFREHENKSRSRFVRRQTLAA